MIIFELYLMEDFFSTCCASRYYRTFFLLLNIVGIGYYIIGMVIFHWFQFYFCVSHFFQIKSILSYFLQHQLSASECPINIGSDIHEIFNDKRTEKKFKEMVF